jgi:hypothetical protein
VSMSEKAKRERADRRRMGRSPDGRWRLIPQRNERAERANARRRGR